MSDATAAELGRLAERRWGLFTTATAEVVGVRRKQLSRMATSGAIERVAHGVYRMTGAPRHRHEVIYATWLALGGTTEPPFLDRAPSIVAAGVTAAVLHEIGDFFLTDLDFVVPERKGTRLPDVRLRVRRLPPWDVVPVNGLPTLTVERTIADLIDLGIDSSLVTDALSDAVRTGKLVAPDRLRAHLAELPPRRHPAAALVVDELAALADAGAAGPIRA